MIGVGEQPSGGLNRGVIVDIDKTASSISKAVAQATAKSGTTIRKVIVGLPANYLQMNQVHGMITVADQGQPREIVNQDVIDVAHSTLSQSLPAEREVIDLVPRDFAVDQFRGIKDPRGMSGIRLELWATVYSGPKTIVHNAKKAIEQANLQIEDLVVGPIATGFNILSDGEQDFGTIIMDLGAGQTTTSIIHDRQLKYSYVDPEGGNFITKDISTVLNTSLKNAEKLKLDHGYADSSQADENVQLAVDVVGKTQPVNYTEEYLAEVIEARVRQIMRRAKDKLDSINTPHLPGGVVLYGGVAGLPGIKQIAADYFNGNVRVFIPDQMGIRRPSFANALSLCMYESSLSDVDQLLKSTVHDGDVIVSRHEEQDNTPNPAPAHKSRFFSRKAETEEPRQPKPSAEPASKHEKSEKPDHKQSGESRIKSFFSNFFD
ncbi:cell division protein FtsA [Limosilactobacillus secaliphilus]|uniref:Cell division protein FtsA n=1 Tax=Limosilactobacillus secaliphilus TaxID=396268 RepID=A0A0R2I0Q8_9LACO|nr:cell division protein FtsA [Limosilactobacillus secaliphilus]